MVKAIQRHPVRRSVTHVDFLVVNLNEEITVDVPIVLEGEAKACSPRAASSSRPLMVLAVSTTPRNIPNEFIIDVSDLTIGDAVRVGRPRAARAASPPRSTPTPLVVTAQATRAAVAEEAEGEGEEGEGAEGEGEGAATPRVATAPSSAAMALFGSDRPAGARGTPADVLVLGLGNPGKEFDGSRHNLGVEVLAELARRHGGTLKRVEGTSPHRRGHHRRPAGGARLPADLHEPLGRVGLSCSCAATASSDPSRSSSCTTSSTCRPGKLKVKEGGGLAGHNGLRSLKQHLKTDAFLRVRIGVGKPPGGKERGADHVLSKPSKRERTEMDVTVQEAADAVEMIVADGVAAAMTRYNA